MVLQSGFLSDNIKIERGCRQGDPISPYLFILTAEILTRLIIQNPAIKGIFINGTEFSITQYADDTTLFLDGSQSSLIAALNTLELFGSFSGLRMNTEKAKVIWIEKKRYAKEKLLNRGLIWGCTNFDLLGLKFSINLDSILKSNFEESYLKLKRS